MWLSKSGLMYLFRNRLASTSGLERNPGPDMRLQWMTILWSLLWKLSKTEESLRYFSTTPIDDNYCTKSLPPKEETNDGCTNEIYQQWHLHEKYYYIVFRQQTCRLPECMETCRQNGAEMASQESYQEYKFLMSLSNEFTGDAFIGSFG